MTSRTTFDSSFGAVGGEESESNEPRVNGRCEQGERIPFFQESQL